MDSNNRENSLKKYDEKNLDKIQSKLVFDNPEYHFIFKKTEKIAAAVYLITNLISDTEPIKTQIRQISLRIVSEIMSFKRLTSIGSRSAIGNTMILLSEMLSFLKIVSISEQVSMMNYSVIQKEVVLLINQLENFQVEVPSSGMILPQDFFAIPEAATTRSNTSGVGVFAKGPYRTPTVIKDNQSTQVSKDSLKDNRRETILKLLKDGKPLGIKDFSLEIKNCSEKTIQRELLDLVEKGVLKKTGERRWSVYSLA